MRFYHPELPALMKWLRCEACRHILTGLSRLLTEHGFKVVEYGVSERYRACMEMVAVRKS